MPDNPFLTLARDAYTDSTSYFDAGPRREIEAALRQFQGLHPHGSKYLHESYRARSRFFRPKTRAAIRKNEAIAAAALFENKDVVTVAPEDGTNQVQVISAAVWSEVLNYRLTKTIPWFMTAIGAYQDAQTVGICISYQHWRYNEKRGWDHPCITLDPVENFRFSPNAKWHDPVGTSPYLIRMIPMYLKDVVSRMTMPDPKTGQPKWLRLDDGILKQAVRSYSDPVTMQRDQGRADRAQQMLVNDYSLVWVHQNFVEVNDDDYVYYTLGTLDMLSVPRLVRDAFAPLRGQRPVVVGNCIVETHKPYSSGVPHLMRDIQGELNENANQRSDNVKFAMNKRYFVRRGKQVDIRSLTRNVPSSVTMMDDPEGDVKVQETGDVTRSAYEEQDRLNLDADDLIGTFSQASAQSNRRIVDSKGGLELLSTESSQMGRYQLRVWAETWAKPVLRQVLLFEQAYETDEKLFSLAGAKAAKTQRLNDPIVVDDTLLMQELTCSVSIGIGATSPQARADGLSNTLRAAAEFLRDGTLRQAGADEREILSELFSLMGYDGADRFFPGQGEDPRVADLQQQLEEANAKLAKREDPELTQAKIKKLLAEADKIAGADKVKTLIESIFGSMQAAEVIAAVPAVTPVADQLMRAAGYTEPTPPGIDPGFAPGDQGPANSAMPVSPAAGLTVDPVVNKRTGVGFTPVGAPSPEDQTPGIPTNTNPMTPALPADPASPFVGRNAGIETMRPDTAGATR